MTKKLTISLLAITGSALFFLNSCSKDDTTSPTITINGATSEEVSLQGTWTDAGATANDDEDGAVQVSSNASSTNPDVNHTGTYTITYSATDAAGNVGTAIRTVTVKNDAETFAKTYQVNDVIPGQTFSYAQTITVDETMNNKVHFNRFGDYANNTKIYAMRDASSNKLSIPLQSSIDPIGTNNGAPCDVTIHYFRSTGFTNLSTGFVLDYVDSLAGSTPCNGSSTSGTATYTF
jgi:hypothetical protein